MQRTATTAFAFVLGAAAGSVRGQATITGLGWLPAGYAYSSVRAVSADGSTAVGSVNTVNGIRAFRWTASSGYQIIDPLPGSDESHATAVNIDGSVVVGYCGDSSAAIPFRWTAAGSTQQLGGVPGAIATFARGVSADGSVVSGYSTFPPPLVSRAFRWTEETGTVDLGSEAGRADAVSGDGRTIVGSRTIGNQGEAVRWNPSGPSPMGTLPGGNFARAYAVAFDGTAAAGESARFGIQGVRPFRWTEAAGMEDLGAIAGFHFSLATGISADGDVVVGTASVPGASLNIRAWIWAPSLGLQDLKSYLIWAGGDVGDWNMLWATGLSADGRTIVGWGDHVEDHPAEAWIARLPAYPCYPNCDQSNGTPVLNVGDFVCFVEKFTAGYELANCDRSTSEPVLNIADFTCFLQKFAAGCE